MTPDARDDSVGRGRRRALHAHVFGSAGPHFHGGGVPGGRAAPRRRPHRLRASGGGARARARALRGEDPHAGRARQPRLRVRPRGRGREDPRRGAACACSTATASRSHGVGFAGVKGFCGGFGRRTLEPWGEAATKAFVHEAVERGPQAGAGAWPGCAPRSGWLSSTTRRSRPPSRASRARSFPFLGSSRLEEPLNRYQVTVAFHGHAHRGAARGPDQHRHPGLQRRHAPAAARAVRFAARPYRGDSGPGARSAWAPNLPPAAATTSIEERTPMEEERHDGRTSRHPVPAPRFQGHEPRRDAQTPQGRRGRRTPLPRAAGTAKFRKARRVPE